MVTEAEREERVREVVTPEVRGTTTYAPIAGVSGAANAAVALGREQIAAQRDVARGFLDVVREASRRVATPGADEPHLRNVSRAIVMDVDRRIGGPLREIQVSLQHQGNQTQATHEHAVLRNRDRYRRTVLARLRQLAEQRPDLSAEQVVRVYFGRP
jgi:hypothetical protein